MNIFIIIDKNSPAANNIKDKLLHEQKIFSETGLVFKNHKVHQYRNAYLVTSPTRSVDSEKIDEDIESILSIKPDIIIFPTTHRSKSRIPSLMVHTQGNWGEAELGGLNRKICISAENFIKYALQYIVNNKHKYKDIRDFDVAQEVTHHGPIVSCPSMFIEIGSSEKEWDIDDGGRIIADTLVWLIDCTEEIINSDYITAFGIGGTHTCSNFLKIMLNDPDIAIGHVCPKYALENLDQEMIKQGMERSMKRADFIILDWKGMGEHKERILDILEEMNIPYKKTKEYKYEAQTNETNNDN
ncbi:MAG: D-aminoacyl-tRNA deacylase [Nanoarchaeota archaeon]